MLDRLPPELIDRILELTYRPAPFPDPDDVDQERRRTLSRCCLVCSALRERAQPLFHQEVALRKSDNASAFFRLLLADEAGEVSSRVKTVRAGFAVGPAVLRSTLKKLPQLEAVHIAERRMLVGELADLAAPTICLSNVTLTRYGPIRPTTIVSLSLHIVNSSLSLNSFFSAELFPSLRALALGGLCGEDGLVRPYEIQRTMQPPPAAFTDQLDMCQLYSGNLRASEQLRMFPTTCALLDSRVIRHSDTRRFPDVFPPHLRILFSHTIAKDPTSAKCLSISVMLRHLTHLTQSPSPLKSLHLPRLLLHFLPSAPGDIQDRFQRLLTTYRAHDVELVYHDEDEDDMWKVSTHFWRYARELKAREDRQ
ncbi:hypothetical protein JCM8097_006638 [Rhodosporidiobolus ruineniae]